MAYKKQEKNNIVLNLLVISFISIKNALVFLNEKYIPQVGAKINSVWYGEYFRNKILLTYLLTYSYSSMGYRQ